MAAEDSIVDRAGRVEHTLHTVDDATAQVAVGGPCPSCGARVETTLHSDSKTVTCTACGTDFPISA
jgi:formamidopyrimidine-DNA glycosylase